jgi:hypothetical protein
LPYVRSVAKGRSAVMHRFGLSVISLQTLQEQSKAML